MNIFIDGHYIYIYIYTHTSICVYIYRLLCTGRMWNKVNFQWSVTGLNSVFFFLNWLPNQDSRTQSTLLFSDSWRECNWIHTFPKGTSAMWKCNRLHPRLKLVLLCPFPTTIAITPWALPIHIYIVSNHLKNGGNYLFIYLF